MSEAFAFPSRKLTEVFRWCVPAILVGLILRVLLVWAMPLAYVQHDSVRLLVSGADWLPEDQFEAMTNNVPFLVPALYRMALRAPGPGLVAIEIGQHLAGLAQILMAGLLVRWWTCRWKTWIVPVTLVFAIHPSFLWYEHVVMLEAFYGLSVMALALAGTWFLRRPSQIALGVVGVATWFVAATRPEGKLFVVFPVLAVVAGFYGRWRDLAKGAAIVLLTCAAVMAVSVKGEGGLLLYSSVIHLSPAVSARYPDAGPYVSPLRSEAMEQATRAPAFVSRPQRIALTAALKQYVKEHPDTGHGATDDQRLNCVAQSLAIEACQQRPWALVPLAAQKFRATADELANGRFTKTWVHDRQISRLQASWMSMRMIHKDLFGRDFAAPGEFDGFIQASFHESRLSWFEWWCGRWERLYARHFPDTRFPAMKLPGLPYLYVLPLLGMLMAMVIRNPARRFHACWVPVLSIVWFIVMVTANERARFRFVFEPFVFLYAIALFAFITEWALSLRDRSIRDCPHGATD